MSRVAAQGSCELIVISSKAYTIYLYLYSLFDIFDTEIINTITVVDWSLVFAFE